MRSQEGPKFTVLLILVVITSLMLRANSHISGTACYATVACRLLEFGIMEAYMTGTWLYCTPGGVILLSLTSSACDFRSAAVFKRDSIHSCFVVLSRFVTKCPFPINTRILIKILGGCVQCAFIIFCHHWKRGKVCQVIAEYLLCDIP